MGMTVALEVQLQAAGLPEPELEYEDWHPTKGYRFDFAWKEYRVAVEKQGGGHTKGRHHRQKGYEDDCRRMAEAVILGWRVLYVTPEMIGSGEALTLIKRLLESVEGVT